MFVHSSYEGLTMWISPKSHHKSRMNPVGLKCPENIRPASDHQKVPAGLPRQCLRILFVFGFYPEAEDLPCLLQVFTRVFHCCFAVKLQKSSEDKETSPGFPCSSKWEDRDGLLFGSEPSLDILRKQRRCFGLFFIYGSECNCWLFQPGFHH